MQRYSQSFGMNISCLFFFVSISYLIKIEQSIEATEVLYHAAYGWEYQIGVL